MKTATVERREVEKQASVEEDTTKKEALDRCTQFYFFLKLKQVSFDQGDRSHRHNTPR